MTKNAMLNHLFSGLVAALMLCSMAAPSLAAGYGYDPSARLDDAAVNIYFGSVKDADGRLMQNATVILDNTHNETTYVGVTDNAGRYRLRIPRDILPAQVTLRLSRRGYKLVRQSRRLPGGALTTPVETDFIVEKIAP